MKQIVQSYKDGNIFLNDVPEPACKAGGLLVRNCASLISIGTEKLMIEMGQKSLLGKARARPDLVRQVWDKAKKEGFISVYKEAMSRLDEPIPLGYSAAGVVQEVGAGVNGFKPGDRVAVVGAGYASHAEFVWVPENLCAPIPEGLHFEAAAFGRSVVLPCTGFGRPP
jgi:threonine dehydrogenase-like Zn-dependent dehydrogenase